ncbi:hypothetical protein DL98DRAFT_609576 [Cadophora sp. DSE1049]|nr:hypothetical protein DL98DRAFT_609576 [Cadophora sp. DSE1049]
MSSATPQNNQSPSKRALERPESRGRKKKRSPEKPRRKGSDESISPNMSGLRGLRKKRTGSSGSKGSRPGDSRPRDPRPSQTRNPQPKNPPLGDAQPEDAWWNDTRPKGSRPFFKLPAPRTAARALLDASSSSSSEEDMQQVNESDSTTSFFIQLEEDEKVRARIRASRKELDEMEARMQERRTSDIDRNEDRQASPECIGEMGPPPHPSVPAVDRPSSVDGLSAAMAQSRRFSVDGRPQSGRPGAGDVNPYNFSNKEFQAAEGHRRQGYFEGPSDGSMQQAVSPKPRTQSVGSFPQSTARIASASTAPAATSDDTRDPVQSFQLKSVPLSGRTEAMILRDLIALGSQLRQLNENYKIQPGEKNHGMFDTLFKKFFDDARSILAFEMVCGDCKQVVPCSKAQELAAKLIEDLLKLRNAEGDNFDPRVAREFRERVGVIYKAVLEREGGLGVYKWSS